MSFRRCEISRAGLLLIILATASAQKDLFAQFHLSADAIVQRLMAANQQRASALRGYRGKRLYKLDYHGLFGSHQAEMQVEASYTAPDKKEFRVISESGSKLFTRVLLRLLDSEKEAQETQNRKALEINPTNYDFKFDSIDRTSDGAFYVLDVIPKGKSRYLYRGKIWVDAHDFAVARMQGVPQKNPSMWVSHTEIEYRWASMDGFWLPVYNDSETQVRMGGKAVLTITYSDYQITGVNHNFAGPAFNESLPNPAAVTADPH